MIEDQGELYEGEKEGGDSRNFDIIGGTVKRTATSPLDNVVSETETKKTRMEDEKMNAEASADEKHQQGQEVASSLDMDQSN
jgi:hypothetical protein